MMAFHPDSEDSEEETLLKFDSKCILLSFDPKFTIRFSTRVIEKLDLQQLDWGFYGKGPNFSRLEKRLGLNKVNLEDLEEGLIQRQI